MGGGVTAVSHIDADHISRLDEEKLRHYNLILKEQIEELKDDIMRVEGEFRMQFNLSPFEEVKPETILRSLQHDIKSVRQANQQAAKDVEMISESKTLKRWLMEKRFRPIEDFEDLFF